MDGSRFHSNLGARALAPQREAGLFEQAELWLPVKTPEGQAEIRQRQRGLSQRQRTMLLLVDGRRSVAQVKQVAVQAGATDTAFDELLDLGLIAVREPVMPELPSLTLPLPEAIPVAALAVADASPPLTVLAPEPLRTIRLIEPKPVVSKASGFVPLADERSGRISEMDSQMQRGPNTRSGPGIVDSVMSSLFPLLESAFGALGSADEEEHRDDALEEARRILVREIRTKAPVTGSITLMKLRRARNRDELAALFDEVDSHISKPMRHLSAQQTLLHVRGLLAGAPTEAWPARA